MALHSAVIEQSTSKVFSYISNKLDDKASTADTIARLEIALSRLDFVLEKTGKIAITYVSLLHRWKIFKRVHKEGMDLLNKYKPQELEETRQVVVRSSSYLQRIANKAVNLSISSLVGFGKARLSSSVAKTVERYADWAEQFVAEVESSCPLRHVTFRYPFLSHLFEGKTLGCEIIGITMKCMQWLTASQFKLVAESAIGELTLLPNLQDKFRSYVTPPSFLKEDEHAFYSKYFRPDPICCNGNSYGTLGNKSSIEIPEPVVVFYFRCCISAPINGLRNAPLSLAVGFSPHFPCCFNGEICIRYGGKEETRNGGSVQQLEEIARSDALDYFVHEPEPTDYALYWFSTHGIALITLRQSIPKPSRRVPKRKR